jgi:hypothetical protein
MQSSFFTAPGNLLKPFAQPVLRTAKAGTLLALSFLLVSPAQIAQSQTPSQSSAVAAESANSLVVDDFESGVEGWTRNDKAHSDNASLPVSLVDFVATRPAAGLPFSSHGAALFSFKSAKGAWASASRRIDGARWAQIGARTLTFWINADGAAQSTDVVLRAVMGGPNGAKREEIWTLPVRLNVKQWRQVTIPLANIKNEKNVPLLPNMRNVYLMQFAQSGTWNSCFFTVDQIEVEGTGTPLPLATPIAKPTPRPAATSTRTPEKIAPGTLQVGVDFLKLQGRITTGADVSVGATTDTAGSVQSPLLTSKAFRDAMTVMSPRLIRLDASSFVSMTDSSKPAFDFSRLVAHVKQVRALGSEPLVALSDDAAWGLDARGFAVFCAQAARAVNVGATANSGARRFEIVAPSSTTADGAMVTPAATLSDAEAVALYNAARAAIKAVSPAYRVGGIASSGGRPNLVPALIRSAQGLDFLTLQFYGANNGKPDAGTLFGATRSLGSLRTAAALLDKSRWKMAPIYITQSNLSNTRDLEAGSAGDARVSQMIAGAWWLSYLGNASRVADAVFHNDAANAGWGLLNPQARAYPSYYAMWMWNTFAPRGSNRVLVSAPPSGIAAYAVNAPVVAGQPRQHNVLLANTRAENTTVRVAIRGFAVLRAVQMQVLDDPEAGVRPDVKLPKSAFQTVTLRPYSVAVVQFIEPPKK